MPFQVSPGVNVSEIDLTTIVPAVSSTEGALAGVFRWGPIDQRVLVDNETVLASRFGKPTNLNAETWFTGSSFLGYGNRLYVSRAANTTGSSPSITGYFNSGNATVRLASGNTANLIAGMSIISSTNTTIIETGVISSVTNSTAFAFTTSGVVEESSPTTGSPALFNANTGVDGTTELITTTTGHSLVNNDFVVYTVAAGNTAIGGLTSGESYYVVSANSTTLKLSNGLGGTPIDITATSVSETGHSLTKRVPYTLQFVTNTVFTAIVNTASVDDVAAQIVKNETDFETKSFTDTDVKFVARFPGELGNSLKVSVCGNASGFESSLNLSSNAATLSVATNANTGTITVVGTAQFTNATFNANTGVNGTTEFITTTAAHGFVNGDQVTYIVSSGNTALTGLTNGNTYFIVSANTTAFKLENTIGGGALDITASSTSETGHTISRTDATAGQNANTRLNALANLINITDKLEIGNTSLGIQYMTITGLSNAVANATHSVVTVSFEDAFKLSQNYTSNTSLTRYWEYFDVVDASVGLSEYQINFGNNAINSDEMHIIVVDEDGKFTGVPGTILETYRAVSRATDAKTVDGAANYYRTVINDASQYIYAVNDISGATSNTAENLTSSILDVASYSFGLGKDGQDETTIPLGVVTTAYDLFKSAEDIDISLVLTGKSNNFQLGNYLIDNIAETRKDCVVFISPQKGNVVNNIGNEAESVVTFRNSLRSTSYGVLDSGYKYMYDRYNDVYRWVPLNGDVAGLCARSDTTNDPWWSPAGFNRGQIKNLVKLAFNPRKAERDTLYKAGVNPVVTFPGQGTVLFGDKTLLAKPSAFDRINVRRLFIVLEKAISTASKFTLFEFNDDFTRAQFRNLVTPYLRDVQGRRGITDFQVVCDASNNTAEVVDRNEFVGDIYIKPARSINFIQLNFVAVRTGVSFSEVVGRF
jgi:hypothetical protein